MEFLDNIFLDNTVRQYLVVFGVILLVIIINRAVSHYIAIFTARALRKPLKLNEGLEFRKYVVKPLGVFLVIVISVAALESLNYPSAWEVKVYNHPLNIILQRIGIVLIIIAFTRLLLKVVDFISKALEEKAQKTLNKNDDQLIVFFRDFIKVFIVIIGGLFIIKAGLNREIGTLLTGLSIIGAALALAAKESLENIIASIIIFFDKPFYVGDTLKVNTITGKVERIGLRSTRIRTPDKTLVTVPNKQMVDGIVDNYSMRSQRRAEVKLELALKNHSDKINEFIKDAERILSERKGDIINWSVFVTEFNRNGMTVTIEYFTRPFTLPEFNRVRQDILVSLKVSLEKLGVSMLAGGDINIQKEEVPEPPKNQSIL